MSPAIRREDEVLSSLQARVEELGALLPELGPTASAKVRAKLEETTLSILRLRAGMAKPAIAITQTMAQLLGLLGEIGPTLSGPSAKSARTALTQIGDAVADAIASLDPVRMPSAVFDPAQPDAAGRLVALALLAQPRLPLSEVGDMYGSGCYALYYNGSHPLYAPISESETPIYVGKADPAKAGAKSAREQGKRLTGRLRDHRGMVRKAERWAADHPDPAHPPISVAEFEYRRLVVASNAQLVAESLLIDFFKPIWNDKTKICWGISKHGDRDVRLNSRSPWDVIHPGRDWAMNPNLPNAKLPEQITSEAEAHFAQNPPYRDIREIVAKFMREFMQQEAVEVGAPVLGPDETADTEGQEQEEPS